MRGKELDVVIEDNRFLVGGGAIGADEQDCGRALVGWLLNVIGIDEANDCTSDRERYDD